MIGDFIHSQLLRYYAPGGLALANDVIQTTVAKEFEKLVPVYEHLRHKV